MLWLARVIHALLLAQRNGHTSAPTACITFCKRSTELRFTLVGKACTFLAAYVGTVGSLRSTIQTLNNTAAPGGGGFVRPFIVKRHMSAARTHD